MAKTNKFETDLAIKKHLSLTQYRNILKSLLVLALALFFQACIPFGLYQNAYNSTLDLFNPQEFEVSPQVKALPYAMQIVEHKGQNAVMVLAFAENNRLAWLDQEKNGFTTYHGKIISSHGLANDFDTINPPNLLEVFKSLELNSVLSIEKKSLVRFLKPVTSYLEVFHSFELQTSDLNSKFKRTLDGKEFSYFILKENVQVPSISWSYSNYYWFNLDGKILKSKQYLTPDQDKYFLETLKDFKH